MKIPKQFKLQGYTVSVHIIPADEWLVDDACGMYFPDRAEIHIKRGSREIMQHTYLHELTHAILQTLNYDRLNKDERFVDTFSGLLHQALTSK